MGSIGTSTAAGADGSRQTFEWETSIDLLLYTYTFINIIIILLLLLSSSPSSLLLFFYFSILSFSRDVSLNPDIVAIVRLAQRPLLFVVRL